MKICPIMLILHPKVIWEYRVSGKSQFNHLKLFIFSVGELWATRKLRLDLCLQLRLFERDALELSSQFELWGEQLQHGEYMYNVSCLIVDTHIFLELSKLDDSKHLKSTPNVDGQDFELLHTYLPLMWYILIRAYIS